MCQAVTDPKKVRAKLRKNQTEFWRVVGITQSGGSRYEAGRDIPLPVQHLLTIAYGTDKQSQAIVKALRG